LKPITRCLWAPIGKRPIALGHHRFDWLYVTAFVSPATGDTFWYVHDGVSKPFFEALLKTFAREAGADLHRTIILVLDNAGWHGEEGLNVPEGLWLVFLPPYTPELQPAETLWELFDDPLVNKHIATIEAWRTSSQIDAAPSPTNAMPSRAARAFTGGQKSPMRTNQPEIV
jgi:DDE superfamily endonuclease